jgi:hypothetical protein
MQKNVVEICKLFPCKTAYYVKRQKKFQILFEKFAFYGIDMELEPERNSNCSKVRTGTIAVQKSETEP